MSQIRNPFRISVLALVASLTVLPLGSTRANQDTPVLLWPQVSIAASQSTKALLIGHTNRAVRFAERALETVKGYDRVVALHNLCLGLLRQGDTQRAATVCTDAQHTAVAFHVHSAVESNINLTRKAFAAEGTNIAQAPRR